MWPTLGSRTAEEQNSLTYATTEIIWACTLIRLHVFTLCGEQGKYDERVCLSVCLCLSASISPKLRFRSSAILCMLATAMARSSSDGGGVAICYVLPVSRMAPCLHTTAKIERRKKGVNSK